MKQTDSKGYVKIWRKAADSELWSYGAVTIAVFVSLLLRARWNDTTEAWRGLELKTGECVFGQPELAKTLGITRNKLRTALNNLQKCKVITTKSTNKYTICTIVKYAQYQLSEEKTTNKNTDKSPTTRQQTTTKPPTNHHKEALKHISIKEKKQDINRTATARTDGKFHLGFNITDIREFFDPKIHPLDLATGIDTGGTPSAILFFENALKKIGDKLFRQTCATVWSEWKAGEIDKPGAILTNRLKELVTLGAKS